MATDVGRASNNEWLADYTRNSQPKEEKRMKVSDTGGGVDFEPAPAGNHVARCHMIIDLGTSHNEMYDTWRRQVFVGFELPTEIKTYKDADDNEVSMPFTVGKFYTASLNEKANLRKDLESWRGKPFTEDELSGFELDNVLGVPVMANVIHKEKKGGGAKADISSISPVPKGMDVPKPVHDTVTFSLDDFSQAKFDAVPKGFQEIIKRSEEYKNKDNNSDETPVHTGGEFKDDDIPF